MNFIVPTVAGLIFVAFIAGLYVLCEKGLRVLNQRDDEDTLDQCDLSEIHWLNQHPYV